MFLLRVPRLDIVLMAHPVNGQVELPKKGHGLTLNGKIRKVVSRADTEGLFLRPALTSIAVANAHEPQT